MVKHKGRIVMVTHGWWELFRQRHPRITLSTKVVGSNSNIIVRYSDLLEHTLRVTSLKSLSWASCSAAGHCSHLSSYLTGSLWNLNLPLEKCLMVSRGKVGLNCSIISSAAISTAMLHLCALFFSKWMDTRIIINLLLSQKLPRREWFYSLSRHTPLIWCRHWTKIALVH